MITELMDMGLGVTEGRGRVKDHPGFNGDYLNGIALRSDVGELGYETPTAQIDPATDYRLAAQVNADLAKEADAAMSAGDLEQADKLIRQISNAVDRAGKLEAIKKAKPIMYTPGFGTKSPAHQAALDELVKVEHDLAMSA
jgi:hypothetical protein